MNASTKLSIYEQCEDTTIKIEIEAAASLGFRLFINRLYVALWF